MARSGTFGKRQSQNGNLTASILALYKQQQAADWTAIQDAWKNGGNFNGEPVTDSDILTYMQGRASQITDTTDPEYVQWNNNVNQLKFSIAESKMGAAFKTGSASAGDVANFYKSQLANYPVDSEIYRTIEKNAGDWAKSAAAAASAGAGAAVTKALKARIDKDSAAAKSFLGINAAVDAYAQSKGWGKTALGTYDVTQLEGALDSGVIIDPSTGQAVSLASWRGAMQSSYSAYGDAADAYAQAGDASMAETYQGYQRTLSTNYIRPSNTFDEREKYQVVRDQFVSDAKAANGNPTAVAAAAERYKTALGAILADAQAAGLGETTGADPLFTGAVVSELNALNGVGGPDGKATGPTWTDIVNGGGSSDADSTLASTIAHATDQQKIDNGTAYYGQKTPTGAYGVFDMSDVQGATFGMDGNVILPPSYTKTSMSVGGQNVEVVLDGQAIYKTVLVDANGNALSDAQINAGGGVARMIGDGTATVLQDKNATIIGYKYFDPTKGASRPIGYGTYDSTGKLVFTTANPIVGTQTADGYVIVGGTGSVGGTKAQGTAINYAPDSPPVTNVVSPGQQATSGDQIQGSATLDPSRGPEMTAAVMKATIGRWAGPTATTHNSGQMGPFSLADIAPSPTQPKSDTGLFGGTSPGTHLPIPTISMPTLPGQGTNLSGDLLHIGTPTPPPMISMPKPPGITAPAQGTNLSGDLLHIGAPTPPPPPTPADRPNAGGLSSRGF